MRTEHTPDVLIGTALVLEMLNFWVVASGCKFTHIYFGQAGRSNLIPSGDENILNSQISRPSLGPIQPRIQWLARDSFTRWGTSHAAALH